MCRLALFLLDPVVCGKNCVLLRAYIVLFLLPHNSTSHPPLQYEMLNFLEFWCIHQNAHAKIVKNFQIPPLHSLLPILCAFSILHTAEKMLIISLKHQKYSPPDDAHIPGIICCLYVKKGETDQISPPSAFCSKLRRAPP